MGTDTPQNREELSGSVRANAAAALDEHKQIVDKLGPSAFPARNDFTWPLIADVAAGGDGTSKPAPAPNKTIPQIARAWAKMFQDMKVKYDTEVAAHKKTQDSKVAADKRADDQKTTFDQDVAKLTQQIKDKIATMDLEFQNLKVEADKKGLDFKKIMDQWAEEKARIEEVVRNRENELKVKVELIDRLRSGDGSSLLDRLEKLNPAKMAERIGKITDKNGTFVNVQFATKVHLVPGQTFVVLPSNGSLVEVIEREKRLEKTHHEFKSLDARDPFADNEFIKGMIEITDVGASGDSARGRITHEAQPIRNPIAKGDQLFNMALSTGEKEHVAYAGIIDLDGDGRPDNEHFVRILERNNLKVDAYLDLKSGQIRGKIDYPTKLLIIGSDAPLVGNVKVMIAQAKERAFKRLTPGCFWP